MIRRQKCLDLFNEHKNKPFIKILTGLRRVGKSTLLDMYIDELKAQGVDESQILKINFELPDSFDITDYQILTNHVLKFSEGKSRRVYLLLDEIGRVKDWEKAINGFHAMEKFDLYITGSNADMLSLELSAYLAGRYIEILIHPFSFKEFKSLNQNSISQDYVIYGGIPSIHLIYNMIFR